MEFHLKNCILRPWREEDTGSLVRYANNRKIWLNLRDAFPHPYSISAARKFIRMTRERADVHIFAIEVNGEAAGSIGYHQNSDVERISAEIGYWLGEPFWNRGITTEAVKAVTSYAIDQHQLIRVYAVPFEWNAASFRVLEKARFHLEGRMRRSVVKDGKIIDQLLYAYVVGEDRAGSQSNRNLFIKAEIEENGTRKTGNGLPQTFD